MPGWYDVGENPQFLVSHPDIVIKPSTVPNPFCENAGDGVFLTRSASKGETFSPYCPGQPAITQEEYEAMVGADHDIGYLANIGDIYVDGKNSEHWTAKINHSWILTGSSNMVGANVELDPRGLVVALYDIHVAESTFPVELTMNYGPGYWAHKLFGVDYVELGAAAKTALYTKLRILVPNNLCSFTEAQAVNYAEFWSSFSK